VRAPEPLITRLARRLAAHDLGGNVPGQLAAAELVPRLDELSARQAPAGQARHDHLRAELARHLPGLERAPGARRSRARPCPGRTGAPSAPAARSPRTPEPRRTIRTSRRPSSSSISRTRSRSVTGPVSAISTRRGRAPAQIPRPDSPEPQLPSARGRTGLVKDTHPEPGHAAGATPPPGARQPAPQPPAPSTAEDACQRPGRRSAPHPGAPQPACRHLPQTCHPLRQRSHLRPTAEPRPLTH
jgi:hypothetical protein